MDDKPKSLSSTEKQDQPVSPSNPVSPSLTEEQAAATALAAADLPALSGTLEEQQAQPQGSANGANDSEAEESEAVVAAATSVGLRQRIVKPSPRRPYLS